MRDVVIFAFNLGRYSARVSLVRPSISVRRAWMVKLEEYLVESTLDTVVVGGDYREHFHLDGLYTCQRLFLIRVCAW